MTVSDACTCPRSAGRPSGSTPSHSAPPTCAGRVVLVNFWTLTCINWLRQEPYVRAWSQAYRDDGLVVIGVHTPEFAFEHDVDRVRRATTDRAIDYPVAVDNDYAIWSAFDNHYWPALYFVDADGVIRDEHFGEGRYEQSERVSSSCSASSANPYPSKGSASEAEADWDHLRTPETYLGYGRGEHFASPSGAALDERRAYELPESLRPQPVGAGGRVDDRARERRARPGRRQHRLPVPRARRASRAGPRARERRSRSACSSTARPPARHTASTSTRTATAYSRTAASTSSSASDGAVRERTLEITFLEPGAEAYAFTFG